MRSRRNRTARTCVSGGGGGGGGGHSGRAEGGRGRERGAQLAAVHFSQHATTGHRSKKALCGAMPMPPGVVVVVPSRNATASPPPHPVPRPARKLPCLAAERQLADALALVVVPDHDLQARGGAQPRAAKSSADWQPLPWGASQPAFDPWPALPQQQLGLGGGAPDPTLLGGYLGEGPPPTIARMLHRNSISTMPMPPSLNPRQNCGRSRACMHAQGVAWPERGEAAQGAPHACGMPPGVATARGGGMGRRHAAGHPPRTVSLKGSQLNTRNPVLMPQAKQPASWLKDRHNTSDACAHGAGGGMTMHGARSARRRADACARLLPATQQRMHTCGIPRQQGTEQAVASRHACGSQLKARHAHTPWQPRSLPWRACLDTCVMTLPRTGDFAAVASPQAKSLHSVGCHSSVVSKQEARGLLVAATQPVGSPQVPHGSGASPRPAC